MDHIYSGSVHLACIYLFIIEVGVAANIAVFCQQQHQLLGWYRPQPSPKIYYTTQNDLIQLWCVLCVIICPSNVFG